MPTPFLPEQQKQQAEFVAGLNQPPKSPVKQNVIPPRRRRGRKAKVRDPPPRAAFSVDEVSHALGLSRPTIYRMMADGTLRYVRFGTLRRIPASELARLLEQNSTP